MSLIDEVKRLREMEKQASPIPWKRWTKSDCEGRIHHKIDVCDPHSDPIKVDFQEDWELIEALRNSAPDLLNILARFNKGDALNLGFALSGEWTPFGCPCEGCQNTTATVRRFLELARQMEREE